ncbi:putative permease [Pyrococcus sp. ST04]|nr:putative permease [Pyrococcus sp. ST04]
MTPSLIFLGVEPLVAVGSDLLFASVTKMFGLVLYQKRGRIKWNLVAGLLLGSLPAVGLGFLILKTFSKDTLNHYLTLFLGVTLIASSFLNIVKERLYPKIKIKPYQLYFLGFVVGLIVQFTSVGAGVVVTFVLVNLARLSPKDVAGVSIAYGLMLSALSFLNYAYLGFVNLRMVGPLIAGSLPGVYVGVQVNSKVDEEKLRKLINFIILVLGVAIVVV